jgi:hypothetical protein
MSKRWWTVPVSAAMLLVVAVNGSAWATAPRNNGLPEGSEVVEIDPATFTTEIDNPYWPMEPGTRWTYRETDAEGGVLKVVVTVTSETKKIANGVTARVVRDTVTEDGAVVEDTFDWYAQDADGSIWYLGEDTAEFEKGKISSRSGSFEAGVDGALAGVALPANPEDDLRYRQEYFAGEAEDQGEVVGVDEQVEVKAGHYEHVLMTKDTNPIEPKVLEFKFYARGVGPVFAIGVSGSSDREELIKVTTVSERAARRAGTTPLGEKYP